MCAKKATIESIIDDFSKITLDDRCRQTVSMDELTLSVNNLSLNCQTSHDTDQLCTQVDKICISKKVNKDIASLFKAIIMWQSFQCGRGEPKVYVPPYGKCH